MAPAVKQHNQASPPNVIYCIMLVCENQRLFFA